MTDDELKLEALSEENVAMRDEYAAMRQENAAAHAETRHLIVVAMEATNQKLQLLVESIAHTREEFARTGARLGETIERTAAETQAMIRFSHAELDRRIARSKRPSAISRHACYASNPRRPTDPLVTRCPVLTVAYDAV